MDIKNLPTDELNNYHAQILAQFKPINGFPLEAYYGVAFMTTKKQDAFQLRLQYDYGKKPVNGPAIEAANLEDAITMLHILMRKRTIHAAEVPALKLVPLKSKDEI